MCAFLTKFYWICGFLGSPFQKIRILFMLSLSKMKSNYETLQGFKFPYLTENFFSFLWWNRSSITLTNLFRVRRRVTINSRRCMCLKGHRSFLLPLPGNISANFFRCWQFLMNTQLPAAPPPTLHLQDSHGECDWCILNFELKTSGKKLYLRLKITRPDRARSFKRLLKTFLWVTVVWSRNGVTDRL